LEQDFLVSQVVFSSSTTKFGLDIMNSLKMHPVAIIGGGPVGLVSSILLSLHKIPHVLFERYPSTSIHPKACGFNQRTVEIFRQIGIEEEILQHCAPPDTVSRTAWYTSLGPTGREIVGRDAWGGGQYDQEYKNASPSPYVVLPQIRLEPILQRRALCLNPDGLRYETEVTKVEEQQDHVILAINHKGSSSRIKVMYCIGADGGRGLTNMLDIGWEGERDIVDMISAHFRAPLSLYHPDTRNFITWFINPALGGSIGTGYLYHLGPYPTDPETEEWLFACSLNPNEPRDFDEDIVLNRMHNTLQLPGLQVELLSLSRWSVNAICATRYRSRPNTGRIFLVGDAAHRIPPWGALGLNTGIQDVYNLVWKLGFAIKPPQSLQSIGNSLLDTYDEERRPIGQRVGRTSLHNLRSHSAVMDTALGICPTNTPAQNIVAMDSFFDPTDTGFGAARRRAVYNAQKVLDSEFHAPGVEIGWFYPTLDTENIGRETRHGGQLDEDGILQTSTYQPSTIPGHHLPHAWLEKQGVRSSTRDLLQHDRFLLVARTRGVWEPFISGVKDLVRIEVITEAGYGGDDAWADVDGMWSEVCGVGETGVVLVRPDGMVAWRAQSNTHVRVQEVDEANMWFRRLMGRVLQVEGMEEEQEQAAKDLGSALNMRSHAGDARLESGWMKTARL
jgi:2-polyprenyl-6-methoxyphenol hydroxylase-like FAD-dependent oxidoreductase